MKTPQKIKVACFGLQGFGNDLLQSLNDCEEVEIVQVYSRAAYPEFAYYDCETMEALCAKLNYPLELIPKEGNWKCQLADLAIISTFHRIFKAEHLAQYHKVINIHPSLLPAYKGATPTNWMLKNGERIVGLTAHLVNEGVDTGPIIFQKRLLNPYLNDHQMRKGLSFLSKEIISNIISQYPNYQTIKSQEKASYYPMRSEQDAIAQLDDFKTIESLVYHIKAFTNYPMPKLMIDGHLFVIDYENPKESIEITIANQSFHLIGYWQNK